MLIEKINFNSFNDYLHLERYVNNGSPSGFSDKYTTSKHTSAKGNSKFFYLCSIKLPNDINTLDFGINQNFFNNYDMLVHPDMITDNMFKMCKEINYRELRVAPTASSRTVKIYEKDGWFIKLNYKGLIGRIDRQIGKDQACSAIEVSNIIKEAIDKNKLNDSFYFQRELFSRVIQIPDKDEFYDWGIVFREPKPIPHNDKIKFLIPAFSLFSKDIKKPNDETILAQLMKKHLKYIEDYVFEELISKIFDCYFNILINCGLQLECHAQNTLIGISENFEILGIVIRDAESIDKDISLMNDLNISNNFKTDIYKCLRKEDYNYNIMHSFMFDFKLGEYLITPIINDLATNFNINTKKLITRIKEYNSQYLKRLPDNFFPLDNKWYSYGNIIHDRTKKRKYISHDKPKYRKICIE